MKDPYKVLGVDRSATDDQIKKAYRELAKKYHPDSYVGNPLSDLVQEKMKEINEAYDQIQKERSSGSTSSSKYSTSSGFVQIRTLINSGRFSEAELILDSVAQSDRNAEWNFLKGVVLVRRGWYIDAQKYLETACYMDPNNAEYKNALNELRGSASAYGTGYRTVGSDALSPCNVCSSLICADCLCECCGGDLISCC